MRHRDHVLFLDALRACFGLAPLPYEGLAPTCHPDRPHAGRGLCAMCYMKYRRNT